MKCLPLTLDDEQISRDIETDCSTRGLYERQGKQVGVIEAGDYRRTQFVLSRNAVDCTLVCVEMVLHSM